MNKIFIKTFGCSTNLADSEAIAGVLQDAGFTVTKNIDEAELVIVNTCIVKQPSEIKAKRYIEDLKAQNKPVVVAGCFPQAMPEKLKGLSLIGIDQISNIVDVVEETLAGNIVTLVAEDDSDRLHIPKIRHNPVVEIIPISQGCLGDCTYCIVKKARGNLRSYPVEMILRSIRKAISQGVKEIWLTAQDTGCYGLDIGTTLPDLLDEISNIPGRFWVRVGMMNPQYASEYKERLAEIIQLPRFFRFLHIPLQSGSDNVLKRMRRPYGSKASTDTIRYLKKSIKGLTFATDIICGFPGETDEDFIETINMIQDLRPEIVNISRYWNRHGTPATRMKQVPGDMIKSRSRRLTSVFEWIAHENNKIWKNWEGNVIIDEHGKDGTFVARNYAYKPIILEGDFALGDILKVKVIRTTGYDLRAIPF